MVVRLLAKQDTGVRFPLPAPRLTQHPELLSSGCWRLLTAGFESDVLGRSFDRSLTNEYINNNLSNWPGKWPNLIKTLGVF